MVYDLYYKNYTFDNYYKKFKIESFENRIQSLISSKFLLKNHTTLNITPKQVFDIGTKEVDKIYKEILKIKNKSL